MPVTFNSNNNYSVDIVTEPDVLNPTVIKYSSDTSTPFVEIKITPDIFQYPLLAGNLNFNSLYRFIDWRAESTNGVNGNVNNSCTPIPTPHLVHSTNTFSVTTFPGTLANGSTCTLPQTNASVTESFQGPFQSERNGATIYGDLVANGVAWTKVIWVEVYEDDNGQMINENFSPEINEDLASWQLWNPNDTTRPITNNVYPYYIRAFVFLEYGSNGPGGLPGNVNIQIDIDETEPVYGCTDPSATNTTPGATIDDGSCTYPASYQINLDFEISSAFAGNSGVVFAGPYTDGSTYTYSFTNQLGITFNFPYTTTDYDDIAPATGNIVFAGSTTQQTVTLSGNYAPGDTVSQLVEIYVYPTVDPNIFGLRIYDFPGLGGPSATQNLISPADPNYTAEIQRMYYGWGNTKNNLTAASLRVQETQSLINGVGGDSNWYNPTYASGLPNFPPAFSLWHVGSDPTGLQPTQQVSFATSFYTGTNDITATEEYSFSPSNPARDYFPNKIKISVPISFTAPPIPGTIGPMGFVNSDTFFNVNNTIYTIPIKLAHITENQGDLNWS